MRIWLDGGFGNQLFQFAFAHYVRSLGEEKVYLFPDPKPRADRPLLLGEVVKFCPHLEIVKDKVSKNHHKIIFRFLRRIRGKKILSRRIASFVEFFLVLERTEFTFMKRIKKKKRDFLVSGYFQNWRYLEPIWMEISDEMNQSLKKIDLPLFTNDFFADKTKLIVLHFRIGDLARSHSTMGILGESYYKKILDEIRRSVPQSIFVIAITDDLIGSQELMKNVEIDRLIGPNELNELECFKLMSLADVVVAANSTFSWWGAMLAMSNGGIGYIPKPWFKNWTTETGDAFEYPGLKVSESSFVDSLNFKSEFID